MSREEPILGVVPDALRHSAYCVGRDAAWKREDALSVIEHFSSNGLLVLGIEIWLPTEPGPTIPTPFIYTWNAVPQSDGEDWRNYVVRSNQSASDYIRSFAWDSRDPIDRNHVPFFNLTI
ncbi:MAG: hypothetical protein WD715_07075 [Dongiaceae bacterium]